MPRDKYDTDLSVLEQKIMLATQRLHPNAYGISIQDDLEKRTGKEHSFGSIYAALERLEQRGFVTSRAGEATAERGGRRKQHFVLSAKGVMALDEAMNDWNALRRGIRWKGAMA